MSNHLWPHEPQHARPACPSPTPGVHPNPCPLSWWYHPTITSSVIPLSSCLQSSPASQVFSNESVLSIRWPKCWSFSFCISYSNEYSGLISFRNWLVWSSCCPKDSQESFPTPQFKSINFSVLSPLYGQVSHPYMTTGKTIVSIIWILVGKVMSLLFNMLFRFVIAFLPKSKHLLISWLQSPSAVILEPKIDYITFTGLEKQTLGRHKQNLVCTRTPEKGVIPQETEPVACECPGISSRDMGWQWPATGSGALNTAVPA